MTLSRAEAKRFYDRFGRRQDEQSFYEDRALDVLIAASAFGSAEHVYEFGCGTGRLAERLLTILPAAARYEGVDLSQTMVALARERLVRFESRAVVRLTGGEPRSSLPDRWADRVVSTYVLDLLPETDIAAFLDDAARLLRPGGRLCLASLTGGNTLPSRLVAAGWRLLFRLSPRIVGGCRPIRVAPRLDRARWRLLEHRVVTAWSVPSEVVVAVSQLRASV